MTEENKALEEEIKKKAFLNILQNKDDLRRWVYIYLGIWLPDGHIDEDSNSSPLEAIWEVYENYRNNDGNKQPGYIWLSARECYKTLGESILNVLLLVHFRATIAHLAAIENQASKAVSYITNFILKLQPYLEYHSIELDSQSKRQVKIKDNSGREAYVKVIIATISGANSDHTNVLSVDEVDVMRFPQAYQEAKLIPGMENGRYPLTVITSTRKYAFGLMNKEVENASKNRNKLLQWNIIDVTERCPTSRHQPSGTKTLMWGKKRIPATPITPDRYEQLPAFEKSEYTSFELHNGCLKCPLAGLCKGKLADRPESDTGDLYKPIDFTIQQFAKISPDMSEAQLMCWRPSSKGLVYPRLALDNFVGLDRAFEIITGEKTNNITLDQLIETIKVNGGEFYGGVDWGYTHEAALVIVATMPTGHSFVVDSFGSPGLETHELAEAAIPYQQRYDVRAWFCDQASPGSIKTFLKAVRTVGTTKCPDFTKDVMAGVEGIRSQIVTAKGHRKLFFLQTEENEFLIEGVKIQGWALNAAGEPTKNLAESEYKDRLDALRYIGQNRFQTKLGSKPVAGTDRKPLEELQHMSIQERARELNKQEMLKKINQSTVAETPDLTGTQSNRKKGMFWNL